FVSIVADRCARRQYFNSLLSAEDRQKFEVTLLQGRPVVINDTLLVPDSDTAFVTAANPEGRFIHGQNHLGYVIAAADSINSKGVAEGRCCTNPEQGETPLSPNKF
ncbi:hypothetical protein, partial [Chromobacterium violaceum]|uniref:hypothetical protein n=1 Tax=Chromobacterium violaceum TaxID=536 RepID=UPI001A965A11